MGAVSPPWKREGDETPAREQRADAECYKGGLGPCTCSLSVWQGLAT